MAMANNLLGGFGAGFNSGQSAGNDIADSRRRNQLSSLASQAYSTPEGERSSLLSQMAAIDPNSAQAQGEAFESEDVRRIKKFENMARLLTSAPEQYREGIYQRMKPSFSGMGASDIPDRYTPEIGQMAEKFLAARSGASGVQSTYVNAQGQRVAIMRDGSQQVLGDANQSIRVLEQAGALPYGVVTSGGVAGQVVPLGGGGQPQQGAPQPYIDPSLPPEVQASIRANPQQWAQAPDMGSMQIPAQQGAPSGPVRTPTAGEIAADQAQAKADAEFRNYDRMTDRVADRAAAEATAKESAKIEAERSVANRERQAAFETFDAAMSELERAMGETVTGPVIGRLPALTADQQTADGTVAAMAPILKQLFRSAGEGVFTDKDQALLIQMLPTREDHPEARDNKVANVRRIVEAKLRAGQSAPQQPAQGGRRLKFNPATGRIE